MTRVPLMRVSVLRPVQRFLRRIGAPTDRLLERLRLPREVFDDPETLIPTYLGGLFIAEAARSQDLPNLGATVAEGVEFADLGMFGKLLANTATLHDLIATMHRLHAAHNSGEAYWLDALHGERALCHRFTLHLDDWCEQSSQYALGLVMAIFRSVTGPGWHPRVYVRTGVPSSIADAPAMRGADVAFDQQVSAVGLTAAALQAPLMSSPLALPATTQVGEWLGSRPARDLPTALGQWMTHVLRSEALRIDFVAGTIGTTPRTLQRRLAEAGTTFADVLGRARFRAATRLLADDDLAIRDVAYEVGYRDAAHLTRAFLRWSGTTPSAFRRTQRVAGAKWQAQA